MSKHWWAWQMRMRSGAIGAILHIDMGSTASMPFRYVQHSNFAV